MKKIFKGVAVIAILISAVISITSCGDFNFDLFNEEPAESEDVSDSESTTYTQPEKVNGKYGSVEDYANSQEIQEQLQSYQSTFSDSLIIKIYGDKNKFIYEVKYLEQIPTKNIETKKQEIEKSLEEQKVTYTDIAKDIAKKVNIDKEDVIVIVRYINADDSLITEVDFTAE